MASREQIDALMNDRPRKLTGKQANYDKAPEGSSLRCAGCFHHFKRVTDGHGVCELVRSEEIDRDGINPAYRCVWFTVDGDIYPLAPEPEEKEPEKEKVLRDGWENEE